MVLWDSNNGPAKRVVGADGKVRYVAFQTPKPKSGTRLLTEAEDNAIGRRLRRRQNRLMRGWLPYAKR